MHPTTTRPPVARRRLRHRLATTSIFAASLLAGLATQHPGATADAAPPLVGESSSPAVAGAATQARTTLGMAQRTGNPALVRRYVRERTVVATMVANELGIDPVALDESWIRADQAHEIAVLSALSQLGTPYRYLGAEPHVAFDCSGLTKWAWAQAGVELTHQSGVQIDAAAPRDRSTAQAGDLVQYPGHVMMYLGAGDAIVHAPNSGSVVNINVISESKASSVRFGNPIG